VGLYDGSPSNPSAKTVPAVKKSALRKVNLRRCRMMGFSGKGFVINSLDGW
jgi:hypothetical protein